MNREIIMDKNMQELTPQGDFSFPYMLLHIVLSDYPFYNFPGHWHPNIEITYILDGEMTYIVNQNALHIEKGDCLLTNGNVLHAGEQYGDSDCRYVCFMFNPAMIYGFDHSIVKREYVAPLLENTNFAYTLFQNHTPAHIMMCGLLDRLIHLDKGTESCYELHVQSTLAEIWALVYQAYEQFLSHYGTTLNPVKAKQLERLKNSLTFIYEHYQDTITLDEIAASCHTSKSEFCRLFKQVMHQTPFDFLIRYRIEQSLPLLCNEDLTITEVSDSVGFSGPSYYAEVFRKYMQCSPSRYRKEHLDKK